MPLYLKQIGFTIVVIGVLEGFAEAVAGLSKSYFGGLSDQWGKRLPFVQAGYALSAVSKPMMALFTSIGWIFTARTLDRLGKGLRTGARDAMLSAEATRDTKGEVFGFHRSMDTLGAVIGPSLALAWLYFHPGDYKLLFLVAFLPGIVAVMFTFLVKEKKSAPQHRKNISLLEGFRYWKRTSGEYRKVAGGLLMFALFNSSDVLLFLKMKESGHADSTIISVYIFYNLVYAILAYPMGRLADKLGVRNVFITGLVFFAITYAGFAFSGNTWVFLALFICYGMYAACTEGISKAWITNIIPHEEAATAIGTYTGFQSIAALIASSLAGLIWYNFGPGAAFLSSSLVSILVILWLGQQPAKP
jgi:MFS family permease